MEKKTIKYGEQREGGQTEVREGDEYTCGARWWVRMELIPVLLDGAGGECISPDDHAA